MNSPLTIRYHNMESLRQKQRELYQRTIVHHAVNCLVRSGHSIGKMNKVIFEVEIFDPDILKLSNVHLHYPNNKIQFVDDKNLLHLIYPKTQKLIKLLDRLPSVMRIEIFPYEDYHFEFEYGKQDAFFKSRQEEYRQEIIVDFILSYLKHKKYSLENIISIVLEISLNEEDILESIGTTINKKDGNSFTLEDGNVLRLTYEKINSIFQTKVNGQNKKLHVEIFSHDNYKFEFVDIN